MQFWVRLIWLLYGPILMVYPGTISNAAVEQQSTLLSESDG